MIVKQVSRILNDVLGEVLGKTDIVSEDLSEVVDIGTEVFNSNAVDRYVKALVNHIGKVVFVDRAYRGVAPSVIMDSIEYGSVVEKISAELPTARDNESWNLTDGNTYNQDVYRAPKVSAKFFNSLITFEVQQSITDKQVKQSFSNATQMTAFVSMIFTMIENRLQLSLENLIMRTINNFTAHVLHNDVPDENYNEVSTPRAINLLKMYNDTYGTNLSAEKCLTDSSFIRFACYIIKLTANRMRKYSTLHNIGGKERFTPTEELRIVLLADLKEASDIYLQSDTFHEELTALPNAESVPFWQGSGKDYSFNNVSDIHVNIKDGDSTAEVVASGILGVMFDRYALGVHNPDRRVTTHYNGSAEFTNYFYKYDAAYFNDFNEQFVVFFVA